MPDLEPTIFVLFGATGDLARRMVLPAFAAAWAVLQPVLDARPDLEPYDQGSWGPAAAQDLPGPTGWLVADE